MPDEGRAQFPMHRATMTSLLLGNTLSSLGFGDPSRSLYAPQTFKTSTCIGFGETLVWPRSGLFIPEPQAHLTTSEVSSRTGPAWGSGGK